MAHPALTPEDLAFIKQAAAYLEQPSWMLRAMNLVGRPVENSLHLLPHKAQSLLARATRRALEQSLKLALKTVPSGGAGNFQSGLATSRKTNRRHQAWVALTGAAGGFFGLPGLPLELAATTTVMLRSIASIARDFGHDLSDPKVRLACLVVFSLGSPGSADDDMESAYYASRVGLGLVLNEAAHFVANKSAQEIASAMAGKSAPALVRFIAAIAARFELVVSEKAVLQALPAVGAAAGATVNLAFTHHFNAVARYHFGLAALEQEHGEALVQKAYLSAVSSVRPPAVPRLEPAKSP